MGRMEHPSIILVSLFILLISLEALIVQAASGSSNGNNGNNNGNGNTNDSNNNGNGNSQSSGNGNNNRNGNGNNNGNGSDDGSTDYDDLTPKASGEERAFCKGKGACYYKTLSCPSECPQRKPQANRKKKGCFINCGSKCEATCKYRKANCNGYGSLCYDPRFVGGDGVMFYFHGEKGGNFAIVSDDKFQINGHFIGSRPNGRTRDYTWVQALSIMFDTHTLDIAAKRVSHWDDGVDALIVRWNGEDITIPINGEAEWRVDAGHRRVIVERTDDANSVRLLVTNLVEMDVKVTPC